MTLSATLFVGACAVEDPNVPRSAFDPARTVTSTCDSFGGTYSGVVFTDEQAQNAIDFAEHATGTELDAVTGIGATTATRIVNGRPYASKPSPVAALDSVAYVTATILTGLRDESTARWCAVDDGRQGCCVDLACSGTAATTSAVAFSDAQSRAVLDWANGATNTQLTAVCNVSATVATGIVAARPVRTLAQLDAVPYIGVTTLKSLKGETTCPTKPSVPAFWCPKPEAECTCETSEPVVIGDGHVAHDYDADGFDDVIVGSPDEGTFDPIKGAVFVYRGGQPFNNGFDATIKGVTLGRQVGTTVAFVGDVNGDGRADAAIAGTGVGLVYLDAAHLLGGTALPVGGAPMPAGDVNGDGYDDIIVGSWTADKAYLFLGGPVFDVGVDATLTGVTGSLFGSSATTAGDMNDDGYDDVVVGAPSLPTSTVGTSAYVYLGGPGAFNTQADFALAGPQWGFGNDVASAGDVNADGYADIVIGSPHEDADAGAAYVYFGGSSGPVLAPTRLVGGVAGDYLGYTVAGLGDVNGDGFHDLAAGAPLRDVTYAGSGTVLVWYGGATFNRTVDRRYNGNALDRRLGRALSAADVNGDGFSDLLAGGSNRVYVYLGSSGGLSTTISTTLSGLSTGFGTSAD